MSLERISNKRTFDRLPKPSDAFALSSRLRVSDQRQIANEIDRLQVGLNWQQLRLEQ